MMQKLLLLGMMAQMKLRKFFSDEKGEVNIVVIVVLIGIAVILALAFKSEITEVLQDLFGSIKGSTDSITETVDLGE